MTKKFILIISMLLSVVALFSGCASGFEFYNYTDGDAYSSIMTGVKAEKTKFNIDDITLDFYYGSPHELSWGTVGEFRLLGVGIFMYNDIDRGFLSRYWDSGVEDYTNMEGIHLVKFIDIEEYNSYNYNVKTPKRFLFIPIGVPTFRHKETLTVPASIIRRDALHHGSYSFCFAAIAIFYWESRNYYNILNGAYSELKIRYEFLDKTTVRLSSFY